MTVPLSRRCSVWAAALLAGLALTASCSGKALSQPDDSTGDPTTTGPATSPSPPAPPAAPTIGECRQLVYSAISHYSNGDPTVSCQSPHTAYTFAVQNLPPSVIVAGASIGNKTIQDAAAKGCRVAFNQFIGGDPATLALSRLSVTYFLPEQQGFNQGAHWVRCDVVALLTANQLAPLPHDVNGFLDDPKALDDYGVCTQGVPGAPHAVLVMCSEHHAYRALAALRLGSPTAPYPGKAVAGTGGQQRCSAFIANALGQAGGYTYGWTYPTVSDWAAGQRFGYCWNMTHH